MKNRTEVNQAVLKAVSLVLAMTIGFKIMCMPALSRVSAENTNLLNNEGGEKVSVTLPELPDSAELERMYEKYDADTHYDHSVCEGAENCPDDVHAGHNIEKWTEWNDPTAMPENSGNFFLTTNVTLIDCWIPADGTSLCLNGHTVSVKEGNYTYGGIIFIKANKTFNLCDCDGKGEISGSNAKFYGGGITNRGTFNMYSGKICGNTTPLNGGGIYSCGDYFDGKYIESLFCMYGGEISGNTSQQGGGIANEDGTIYIYGGKIKENKSEYENVGGGGLYLNQNSECYIYGGEITKNTARIHGGIYVNYNSASVVIGGNAVIKDNICDSIYNYKNLYLPKGITVTLDTANPLTENAYIGVSTEVKPSDGSPVDVTGTNNTDYSKFFHSDDPAYEVNNSENDVVQLRVHTHSIVHYEAVSPTCTENGYDEHWVCEGENGCGKIFADENAKNELDEKPIIGKLKHDYAEKWQNDSEKHWKKCKNCDAVEPDSEKPHDWDEGKITVEPTTEKEGEKTFTCEICGYERTEELPKLEVSETTIPETSPSETTTPVTPPSETEPPVTPPSETEPPVTPPSETNPPVTPPSETDTPVTPPSETDPPVTPPSETEPPVTPSTESSNFHGGFVIPETSTSTYTAADPVSSYSETIPEETAAQTSDTSDAAGVGTGSISKRVESADYTIELCDSVSELANNVLTNRERLLTDSGSNAEIILTAEKIDTVSESDGIAVREALDDFEVWQYLDINLYKIIDGIRYKLTDTDRAVTVKIVIPETLRENDIEYAVIRVHNGTADVLKDLDSDADTITFATDKFSVYAFVCKDKDVNADSPLNTGVESYTSIFIAVGITSMSAAMTFSLIGAGIGGMSEERKEKLYRKLIIWGKGGGKTRRLIALALIFLMLSYYYGIGKSAQRAR